MYQPLFLSFNAFIATVVRICFSAYMAITVTQNIVRANSSLFQNEPKYFFLSFFNFLTQCTKKYSVKQAYKTSINITSIPIPPI